MRRDVISCRSRHFACIAYHARTLRSSLVIAQQTAWSSADVRAQDSPAQDWSALTRAAIRFARLWRLAGEDAEDIAQQALLALVRSKRPIHAPLDWLFVVTRRLTLRARTREQQLRAALSERQACRDVPVAAARDALTVSLHSLATDHTLPLRDRRILIWTAVGYSHAEIARRLNCSRADVGQYVARARKRIIAGHLAQN
jgi:RNA polymerase sigma factor (sigma-70 family)